jgi:hypothetical protein
VASAGQYLFSRSSVALVLACLIPIASGCRDLVLIGAGAAVGVGGVIYVMGKLEAEVEASVPRVQKAAVAGLKDLDLPVTQDKGRCPDGERGLQACG